MIIKLNLILPAQSAEPKPPLGPFIAQKGVPGPAFCEEFNSITKPYPKGMMMNISILISGPKKYKIQIRGFNVSHMLKTALKTSNLSVPASITMNQIDDIVSEYNKYFLDKGIKKKIISVLRGTKINLTDQ